MWPTGRTRPARGRWLSANPGFSADRESRTAAAATPASEQSLHLLPDRQCRQNAKEQRGPDERGDVEGPRSDGVGQGAAVEGDEEERIEEHDRPARAGGKH